MEPSEAGLRENPFRVDGQPPTVIAYAAQRAALEFFAEVVAGDRGLGLFQGPPLSGKSTILRQFVGNLPDEQAVAIVDGNGVETNVFLQNILAQFGYDLKFDSINELVNMLKVFALQQTVSGRAPLVIVENTHTLSPAALAVLCDLAALEVHNKCAMRLIFASDRSLETMIKAPAMGGVAQRVTGSFFLEPLTGSETRDYVYDKLRCGGLATPEKLFPLDVCDKLYDAGGGWPGVIDYLANIALMKAKDAPVTRSLIGRPNLPDDIPWLLASIDTVGRTDDDLPVLFLSYQGQTPRQIRLDAPRLLIGRSEHNDLQISSRYISRHHAMFVRHGKATFLLDLNSTNGTFVNSRRISNLMLMHEDIVLLGNHRIKFIHPSATERLDMDDAGFTETMVMQSLQDVRSMLAAENIGVVQSEPASGNKAVGSGKR